MNSVLAAIANRRSANPRRMTGPGPSVQELALLAEAAAAAPDHGRLGPLRLENIADQQRASLADVFADAAREANIVATPEDIAAARDRALAGPCLLAVIARIDVAHPVIPASEQWISVGAGLQNVLLVLESLGYQSKMVSGRRVQSAQLRNAFALDASSHLVGFIVAGRGADPAKLSARRSPADVLSEWQGLI